MPLLIALVAILAGTLFVIKRANASIAPTEATVIPFPFKRESDDMTRGERNNNPGNLRNGATHWQGERAQKDDATFEEFETPEAGIRALAILLLNYQRIYGLRTLTQIISRYAPSNENNTGAYIDAVSTATGFAPSTPVNLNDPDTLRIIVRAIIRQENGRVIYSDDQISLATMNALKGNVA